MIRNDRYPQVAGHFRRVAGPSGPSGWQIQQSSGEVGKTKIESLEIHSTSRTQADVKWVCLKIG